MSKLIRFLIKALIAGMLALLIASAVCFVYSNPPIHFTNETGATDYIWEKNHFTSTMTEGFAWNITDKNGFYNSCETDTGMDILLMGSSHLEASNVFMHESTSYLLSSTLGRPVYSIATAGHTFLRCVSNLPAALDTMKPTDYVIIETSASSFLHEEISDCLEGRIQPIPSNTSLPMLIMQKLGYLRLAYHQLELMIAQNNTDSTTSEEAKSLADASDYVALAKYIADECNAHSVRPIVLFHSNLILNSDATVSANIDEPSLSLLKEACEQNGIVFVDMTEDFLGMYESSRSFPNGFSNTEIAYGHLNAYGHKAVSSRLASVITELEINGRGRDSK